MDKKEFATVGGRISSAKSLRGLDKSKVYNLEDLLPLAEKEIIQKRKLKKGEEVRKAEIIMHLQKSGFKFIEKAAVL